MFDSLKRVIGRGKRGVAPAASSESLAVEDAAALKDKGNECLARGDHEGAAAFYRQAIAHAETYPEAHSNLGVALQRLGRLDESEAAYRRAIELRPRFLVAWVNLGNLLLDRGRNAEAETAYRRALDFDEKYAKAWLGLGNFHRIKGEGVKAIECFRAALHCEPALAEAANNIGVVFQELGQYDAARSHFEQALKLAPDLVEAQWNRICAPLFAGDYEKGWPLFESRFDIGSAEDKTAKAALLSVFGPLPRWRGEPLGGRRLLLWTEQGAGDSIMMLRYVAEVGKRWNTTPDLLCESELLRLSKAIGDVGRVFEKSTPPALDHYAGHCPLMSLPLICGTRLDTIPGGASYLSVPDEARASWLTRLAQLPGLKVGLVWAGNPRLAKDALRSIDLSLLGPLLEVQGVSFISLQKGPAAGQLMNCPADIRDWMNDCRDFLDTAALVSCLDLVIAVDTSVAHLAGALGKPVWLLNRYESEWRWLRGTEHSPWYPRTRIFSQDFHGDWNGVLMRVAGTLRTAAGNAVSTR